MTVVDLGAAPGGWSQFAAERVGSSGMVFALDILPMEELSGVNFIQGDFCVQTSLDELLSVLSGRPVDIVISDMAPNISGVRVIDQPRAMYLAELAADFAGRCLKPGGDFLVKTFQGEGFDAFLQDLRNAFTRVSVRKPKSSRARSTELYLLARNYRL
jgi:23S rRNA (uridine2552-2'-O)-methyltransferase